MCNKPKIQGTVKWFSNKKGYGFITPAEGSPITCDVFVHHSNIISEGYRTLDKGWLVEFIVVGYDGGRVKAENVTGSGEGPCSGPLRSNKKRRNGRLPQRRNNISGPHWHAKLNDNVLSTLKNKGIRATTGTIDVGFESVRVKLGSGGYSSIVHKDAILGEGCFECDEDGNITMNWEKYLVYVNGEWKKVDNDQRLPTMLLLVEEKVVAVQPDETAATLWGEELTNPRQALEDNGFLMRRVVIAPRKRR